MGSVVVDGVKLNYLEQGAGEPLVLMHGNAGSCMVWRKVMPLLATRFRVLAYDRRGFGHSDKMEEGDASPRGYAQELAGFMNALGIERARIGGVSFGGFVAQCFALDFPCRIDALILVGTTADRTGRSVPESLAELARDGWEQVARRLVRSWFRADSDPSDVREALAIALQSSQRMRELTVTALGSFDIRQRIGGIAAPTLVVTGRQDITCPPAMAEDIARRIPGARVEFVEQCGHLVPVEQPRVLSDLVLGFLKAVDDGH